ncbi:MAG: His/Gly/Thr/Pro-type tRNA ligase C-terminal domain-containing protein [Candidatus Aenigmatarchaeota archaeon]|nr:hypothetical protein [Candidatus Aenigmarchaeota archaeon]
MVKKEEDFEKWYEIVKEAEFATSVDGWTVLMPTGLETWHLTMDRLNDLLLAIGYQNWYFPLTTGKADLLPAADIVLKAVKERIKNINDLPLRIDNYINLQLRTKSGLILLADKEALADECWSFFATQKEAEDEVKRLLSIYRELVSGTLGLDYLELQRPWMGDGYTIGLDVQLPNGRIVNLGTISFLGQSTGLKIGNSKVWVLRANLSSRMLGALAAVHGDVRGLILPPAVSPLQAVIIPVGIITAKVMEKCGEVLGRLEAAGYRVHLDNRDIKPEDKVHEWEMKGVPLRIEIGPAELAAKQVTFVRRDFLERITIEEEKLETEFVELSDSIAFQLRKRGMEAMIIQDAAELSEAKKKTAVGFVRVPHCMGLSCGRKVEKAGLSARGLLFGKRPEIAGKRCVGCGRPAKAMLYVGKPI